MSQKGLEFELFVKAIYEEILSLDSYNTIKVEHDVKVLGKSTQAHQIDVYWEFKIAGIIHKVAVECKEYASSVSVGKVRDFYGALNDIGNIQGIFVTTKGYQKGAITYAKHKDISLKTVSEPTDEEIDAQHQGIKTLCLNSHALCIDNCTVNPILDMKWIFKNTELREGDEFSFGAPSNEIKVLDSKQKLLGTLQDYENRLPRKPENTKGLTHKYSFDEAYIYISNSKYPPIKLDALQYKYDTFTINSSSEINFKIMAKAIIKDILTGESHLFRQQTLSSIINIENE